MFAECAADADPSKPPRPTRLAINLESEFHIFHPGRFGPDGRDPFIVIDNSVHGVVNNGKMSVAAAAAAREQLQLARERKPRPDGFPVFAASIFSPVNLGHCKEPKPFAVHHVRNLLDVFKNIQFPLKAGGFRKANWDTP